MNVLESPRMFLLPVSSSSIFFSDILYESIKIYDFVLYNLENTIIPTMCRNVTLPYIVKIKKKYIIYDNKRVIHTTMSLSFGNISSLIFVIPGVFRIFSINYIKTYLLNIWRNTRNMYLFYWDYEQAYLTLSPKLFTNDTGNTLQGMHNNTNKKQKKQNKLY